MDIYETCSHQRETMRPPIIKFRILYNSVAVPKLLILVHEGGLTCIFPREIENMGNPCSNEFRIGLLIQHTELVQQTTILMLQGGGQQLNIVSTKGCPQKC